MVGNKFETDFRRKADPLIYTFAIVKALFQILYVYIYQLFFLLLIVQMMTISLKVLGT